ncbi:PilZ domain-containing protein [Sphingomonas sp. S2-65]|uniref:PilZ domain-containing protein n=1 Tax=Sphingomonas sp. S2-65 TaxID=2903960 RepID=UPI001F41D956|nr:PilZ domain-containing protein [Sphingomonas sp. S2-65]UYY58814.1 PilZ domain-containing protein [Sphingomonas sp. S2-65]
MQPVRSGTVFSLAADPPRAFADAREAHTAFDAALLIAADAQFPCSLEKLTAVGATLCLTASLAAGDAITLELSNGQGIAGRVEWITEGEAGILFDQPIDVIGTIARTIAALPADRRHLPRVELRQTVAIRQGGRVEHGRTRNISQGGLAIESTLDLKRDDPVQLTLDGLRPLGGTVRWARERLAGIAFDEDLGWQTLMPWLRGVQQAALAGVPATSVEAEAEGMIPDKHAIRLDAPARVREGVRWWNARVRGITAQLVELETRAHLLPGAQLWVSLPEIGGGPASVVETANGRILCEFRLPLRPSDLGAITGQRRPT